MSIGRNFYEKKIKYLDYFEGQMRIGGGGFVKLEVRDGKLRMDLTVTGLHATDTFARDMVLCGKGRERVAGRIDISGGRGQYRQQWQDLEDIGGTGIGYWDLQGIRIPLGAGREVSGRWQETGMPARERQDAALAGRRSGEGYAREVPGTREGFREEGRRRERIAAERYGDGEGGAEEGRYRRDETEEERYQETGVEEREEGARGGTGNVSREVEPASGQMETAKEDWVNLERNQESYAGMNDGMAEQAEEGGSRKKIIGGHFEEEGSAVEMAEKEMSEETPGEMPEKAMSEKERTAAERWKIEEDTETETIPKESEIKATEGGKGGMAKARRGVTHSSNEGNAAGEGRKSRGNGMSWVDSRGFGGHATDSSVLKREKPVYETGSSRYGGYVAEGNGKALEESLFETDDIPGGYAAKGGLNSQEHDRYGMDGRMNKRNNILKKTGFGSTGEEDEEGFVRAELAGSRTGHSDRRAVGGGAGNIDGRAIGNGTGYGGGRSVGSGGGNVDGRSVGSGGGNVDGRTIGSGTGNADRRSVGSGTGYGGSRVADSREESGRGAKSAEKQIKPMEDKWPQLWAIYPHIRPFQDQREYLSIGPSDFVLFPAASYKAVNNSFLLHGYYNYKHLILARVEKKGDVFYYIGVPGNFYEREKQVAIMFGFESFECAEEPAQVGDFGYYMMRTEL